MWICFVFTLLGFGCGLELRTWKRMTNLRSELDNYGVRSGVVLSGQDKIKDYSLCSNSCLYGPDIGQGWNAMILSGSDCSCVYCDTEMDRNVVNAADPTDKVDIYVLQGAGTKSWFVRWENSNSEPGLSKSHTAKRVFLNTGLYKPTNGAPWLGSTTPGTHGTFAWKSGVSKLVTKVEIMNSYFNGTWWEAHRKGQLAGTKDWTLSYTDTQKGPEKVFVSGTFEDPGTLKDPTNPRAKVYQGFQPLLARYFVFRAQNSYGRGPALQYIKIK